jgi:biotin carboxyl carrier protein
MTEDKSKLLRSLTIDRSASKAERPGSRWLPISAAIVACVVAFGAFGAYEFRRQDPPKETAPQIAQQPAAQPQTPQPATNNKPAGSLAASGYVVARRKATVAAEITGKVVEVFIDEGMTVTEGRSSRGSTACLPKGTMSWPARASRRPMPRSPRSPPIWRTRPGS